MSHECVTCRGTGEKNGDTCPTCGGSGRYFVAIASILLATLIITNI